MALFKQKLPEEVAKRVPPGQRLVKGWPVLHFGSIPHFDESTWDLRVYGLVENEYTLSYSELKALPKANIPADMHCVTGWTTLDNDWQGIPFRVLAEKAGPKPEA
ncbi:MAG TPA: molybdopterin-dependent oxidoreductase, partial [Actinomycetota bacterium]